MEIVALIITEILSYKQMQKESHANPVFESFGKFFELNRQNVSSHP